MTFRYFDRDGNPLSPAQLRQMELTTPVMEHVFASVLKRARPPESSSKAPETVVR